MEYKTYDLIVMIIGIIIGIISMGWYIDGCIKGYVELVKKGPLNLLALTKMIGKLSGPIGILLVIPSFSILFCYKWFLAAKYKLLA